MPFFQTWADDYREGCWNNGVRFQSLQSRFTLVNDNVVINLRNKGQSRLTLAGLEYYTPALRFKKRDEILLLTPQDSSVEDIIRLTKEIEEEGRFISSAYLSSLLIFEEEESRTVLKPDESTDITTSIKSIAPSYDIDELLLDKQVMIQFRYHVYLEQNNFVSLKKSIPYACYSPWFQVMTLDSNES